MDDTKAIDAALESRWDEALKLNKRIIKLDPQNVDALNRQARCYMEMGKSNLAKKYYSEALKFDPYNPIALKNLKIMKSFKSKEKNFVPNNNGKLSPSLFLQEPGKTKMVSLLKVAEPQKLSLAFCGMKVDMAIKNRKITIVDGHNNYLGVLPDDINHQMLRLIKGGNKFEIIIKSVKVNGLSIIIKEIFRSKRFKNQPSFPEYSDSSTALLTSLGGVNSETNENQEDEEEQEA